MCGLMGNLNKMWNKYDYDIKVKRKKSVCCFRIVFSFSEEKFRIYG